jgi:Skp family chaperone for outer membrane proteins
MLLSTAWMAATMVVDLEAAVLATPEGLQAERELKRRAKEIQATVDRERAMLLSRRAQLGEADFESRRRAFNRSVDARQEHLRERERRLLDPLVAEVEATLERWRRAGHRVVVVDRQRVLGLPSGCDLTEDWRNRPVQAPRACERLVVVGVRLGEALASTPAAVRATQALNRLRDERQAMLAELNEQPAESDADRKRRAALVQDRFEAYQAEIAAAESAAEARLREQAVARLRDVVSGPAWRKGFLQLDGTESDCDGTAAARAALQGESGVAPWLRACPALRTEPAP